MSDKSKIDADNERIRLQKIANERADIKKNSDTMKRAISGGRDDSGGCFSVILIFAAVPFGLWVADKLA